MKNINLDDYPKPPDPPPKRIVKESSIAGVGLDIFDL